MTTATHHAHATTPERVLFMAVELREKTWQRGCTTGHGHKPRARLVAARDLARLRQDIAQAKRRCGLSESALVVRCDAAGRAGCWLHRFFQAHRIRNPVVDASSLAGNRRQRRAKRAGLDGRTLVRRVMRYAQGERDVWRVVQGPTVAAAEGRHLHRD